MTDCAHTDHRVVPFAMAFNVSSPKLHAGVFWCQDCKQEVCPENPPARTQ